MSATIDSFSHENPYNRDFWLSYCANLALIVGMSSLFRYADFISYLGGGPYQLGLVTGCGMTGGLLGRFLQGRLIDRLGPRMVWLSSLLALSLFIALNLTVEQLDSAWIYLLRIGMMISLAGAFGASLTSVSLKAPPGRTAEMVGVLGSSGFVGLAIGPVIGDWIFRGDEITFVQVRAMFLLAASMMIVSMALAYLATRRDLRAPHHDHPSALRLVRQFHPGWLLLIGVVVGAGVLFPQVFVRSFTESLNINQIQYFFLAYAFTAFSVRIATRQFTDQYGVKNTVILGMVCLTASMLAYLPVSQAWMLPLPALFGGAAHAFLFPAVVAGGSTAFPRRYRGTGTNLMLASLDFGSLVGFPLEGAIVSQADAMGWPGYPTMFVVLASLFAVITLLYAAFGEKEVGEEYFDLAKSEPPQTMDPAAPPSSRDIDQADREATSCR
ncbi:MFS transporter [Blastopirellula marina]|uniref:Putative permease of the major facilitator superfamily protein n=1 Tax=Blastopirellula marina DSM 3645 TaxID=314230 RepID=A3ZY06_9BACT|nr:MFS transporter [Blastopirellula marina]EAQ78717.1 putative permease of the major facilitator superfamily protein [Blastopirellula marina DSM 3645]